MRNLHSLAQTFSQARQASGTYQSNGAWPPLAFERRERHDRLRIKGELGKQGSNLNQLTYAVNAGRLTALTDDDLRVIDEARIAVEAATALIRTLLT
ncbi:hypothetical protein [Roseinatronobacter sp.]|uniref:hypothetical protein n=1 Tax=Roseinatronobacter sp. TaxID=1945755 RepID=UPI0025FC5071|nr:hypothetical protein [Roseibaca sp.]